MLRSSSVRAGLLAALVVAHTAAAATYDVTVVGTTENTLVEDGDACGTGNIGPGACNDQTIVVAWRIFADDAPGNQSVEPDRGIYAAGAPLFLSADVTIHGQAFSSLAGATASRNQSIDIWDDLNASGITDRILFGLSGSDGPGESFVSSNLLLPQTFTGVGLDVLGVPFDGPPVFPGTSTFVLANEVGTVAGQFGITSITMGAPEPLAAAHVAAAIAALTFVARRRPEAGRPVSR